MVSNDLLQAFLDDEISFTECLEIMAVACGQKKIACFIGNAQRLRALEAFIQRMHMPCAIAPLHLEPVFSCPPGERFGRVAHGVPQGEEEGILFAGAPDAMKAAVEMELHGNGTEQPAELYGYPLCCVRNYNRAIQHGASWVDSFLAGTCGMIHASWLINRFGPLFPPYLSMLPDYFPCHINCTPSLALAKEYLDMLEQEGLGVLAELAKKHLARPVLHYAGCLYQLDQLTEKDGEIAVSVLAVWPYAGQALNAPVLRIHREGEDIAVSMPGKTGAANNDQGPAACLIFV